jgi:GGDEF domain-containing protein
MGQNLETTASIGASMFPQDGMNSKQLIKHADLAFYKAKETRNHFQFYCLDIEIE